MTPESLICDPDDLEISALIEQSKHKAARWLRFGGHVYYWRAEDAYHKDIAAIVGGMDEKGIAVAESEEERDDI